MNDEKAIWHKAVRLQFANSLNASLCDKTAGGPLIYLSFFLDAPESGLAWLSAIVARSR